MVLLLLLLFLFCCLDFLLFFYFIFCLFGLGLTRIQAVLVSSCNPEWP